MSQHYSNPARESDPHALPNIETFRMAYAYCPDCDELMLDEDAAGQVHCLTCIRTQPPTKSGWFYWHCFPSCMPDSAEPQGPFETEALALEDAREGLED